MPGDDRARRVAEWVRGRANARHAFDRVSLRRRARRTSGRYPEAAVGAAPSPPRSAWARCFADASRAPRPSARRLPCPSGTSRTPGARRAWTPSCSTGENARVYARIRGTAARAMTCPRADSSSKTGLGELERSQREAETRPIKIRCGVGRPSFEMLGEISIKNRLLAIKTTNSSRRTKKRCRGALRQQREGSPSLRLRAAERHPRVR